MKREDFKIEGIPEGYRVYSVDLTPSGRPIAVLGHATDRTLPVFARWHGADVPLADDALWWNDHLKQLLLVPIVRAAGEDQLIVVDPSAGSDETINGWVWSRRGELGSAFHAGDGVQEVLANENLILLFYSDQGQTGNVHLSREAMAVMSAAGEYLWGHWSQFGSEEALTTWFHAAVWEGPDEVAILADVRHECAFVRLDIGRRQQRLWHPPLALTTPSAVTTIADRVVLHGAGADATMRGFLESFANDPKVQGKMKQDLEGGGLGEDLSRRLIESFANDPKVQEMLANDIIPENIVEWRPGETTWRVIGEWPARQLRGLPGGRFVAVKPDGYTILSFE